MNISVQQSEILQCLWREGRLSRSELYDRTGIRPNSIGALAETLLEMKVIRQCKAVPSGGGRPRVPLELDPCGQDVIGMAIGKGTVGIARLNLLGQLVGQTATADFGSPDEVAATCNSLLRNTVDDRSLSVGVTLPGFVEPAERKILFSAAVVGRRVVDIAPVYDAVGPIPMIVNNDMHALAARWLLSHCPDTGQDVLLVSVADGAIGAAVLIGGRPNRGSVLGANELGHMRFAAGTDVCYCGQTGCLERICSSQFLNRASVAGGLLLDQARQYDRDNAAMATVIEYLSRGIANAVNFIRPHRLVLVSELTRCEAFIDELTRTIKEQILAELLDRTQIDLWDQPTADSAETAGWLALAGLYLRGWLVPDETRAK